MIAFLLAQTIAITGGTVYPVSGPKIENATVLIRDGRIAAVGANVAVPAGATRIDASGKWVTPGFIDGAGQMGLREIEMVDNTNEYRLRGNDVAASFNVLEGINPASTLIAVNRMEGVTSTLAVPGSLGVPPSRAHRSRRDHHRSDADKTAGCHGCQLERVSEGCRRRVARCSRPTTAPSVERRPRVRDPPRRLPAPPDPGSQRQRRGSRGAATGAARRAAADRGREPPQRYRDRAAHREGVQA